jgi:murein DD-endopeptidase MepM/ murein hydrolase activator NlpD
VQLDLRNQAAHPVQIRRSEVFVTSEGGWAWSLGEQISQSKNFFGRPATVAGSSQARIDGLAYGWSAPVAHFLVGLDAPAGGEGEEALVQVPISRPGYAPPQPLPGLGPVYIGLQEPMEALQLATGQRWLTVVGQVINSTGKPLSLSRWRMNLKGNSGAVIFDNDLTSTFQLRNSTQSLNEFMYGFVLPNNFGQGTLNIEADYVLGGQRRVATRNVAVRFTGATVLHGPTIGLWNYGNGPGELVFHTHYHWPEQRFAYDMGVLRKVGGNLQSHGGDPGKNESYFCWKQPIHCMADGIVKQVYDRAPDNFGDKENPANNPKTNNRIVVEHSGTRYSIYVHVCQGCATVKEGQRVATGQVLGRVGNAGFSSEPTFTSPISRSTRQAACARCRCNSTISSRKTEPRLTASHTAANNTRPANVVRLK